MARCNSYQGRFGGDSGAVPILKHLYNKYVVKDWGKSRHSEERRGEIKIIKENFIRGKVLILYY